MVRYDLADAIDYYTDISAKLGTRFESDFVETLNRLENTPQHYFNLENGFRRINLSEFPYMLLYKIEEEFSAVKVFGVFHQHSNPSFVKRRIRGR